MGTPRGDKFQICFLEIAQCFCKKISEVKLVELSYHLLHAKDFRVRKNKKFQGKCWWAPTRLGWQSTSWLVLRLESFIRGWDPSLLAKLVTEEFPIPNCWQVARGSVALLPSPHPPPKKTTFIWKTESFKTNHHPLPGVLTGNRITSRAARTRTSIHTGCQHCRWSLNLWDPSISSGAVAFTESMASPQLSWGYSFNWGSSQRARKQQKRKHKGRKASAYCP